MSETISFWRKGDGACPITSCPSSSSSSLDQQMRQLVQEFGAGAVAASLQRVQQGLRCRQHKEKEDHDSDNNDKDETETDCTDDHLVHMTVEQERELNRALLDASFEAVVLSNARGRIIKVNRAALRVLKYADEKELLGQSVSVMVGGGEAKYHDEYFEKYRRRGMHSPHFGVLREVRARRRDGTEFPCILGIKKIKGSSSPLTVGFLRDITKEKEAMELAVQKRAAEELLVNVLPEEVAARLQEDPRHIADHFTTATILFADIVGFTRLSSRMPAVDVVAMLNDVFSRFDQRLEVYKLNKIKTIGDCYMVCSVPSGGKDPNVMCRAVCHFALDMLDVLDQYNDEQQRKVNDDHPPPLTVRIGMDCGPIVAGVIGTKRFLYDVWGHPVNVASRMESTGVPGRIQVTKKIVDSVPGDEFTFASRGTIEVKGIGAMATFFLEDRLKTRSSTYWSLLEPSSKIGKICPLSKKSTRSVSVSHTIT